MNGSCPMQFDHRTISMDCSGKLSPPFWFPIIITMTLWKFLSFFSRTSWEYAYFSSFFCRIPWFFCRSLWNRDVRDVFLFLWYSNNEKFRCGHLCVLSANLARHRDNKKRVKRTADEMFDVSLRQTDVGAYHLDTGAVLEGKYLCCCLLLLLHSHFLFIFLNGIMSWWYHIQRVWGYGFDHCSLKLFWLKIWLDFRFLSETKRTKYLAKILVRRLFFLIDA